MSGNKNIRLIVRCITIRNAILWLLLAVALVATSSCSTVKYVPVENTAVDSVYINVLQRDSIFVQDSVYIREKADTVFVTRWHVEYRDALRVDTVQVVRTDSIQTIVEVEKKLTKVQQLKMDVGAGVLYAVPILIAVGLFVLYRKLKK